MSVICLSGGVGGSRFANGLQSLLPSGDLRVIVNTGDDFQLHGLYICPDIDSVLYSLAAVSDAERGWGRANETWQCLDVLSDLGQPDWFRLGDKDLAIHIVRTNQLRLGMSLKEVIDNFCVRLGVPTSIIPMTEDAVMTFLHTDSGLMDFQEFFVKRRCQPTVQGVFYKNIENADLHVKAFEAMQDSSLEAIFIAPSNPFLSIDPILSLPGMREVLSKRRVPCVAISPLVGGRAVKGPLGEMLDSLKGSRLPNVFVEHYSGLIDGLILDESDVEYASSIKIPTHFCSTLMRDQEAKTGLALSSMQFASRLHV